jgi:hypothetical protein
MKVNIGPYKSWIGPYQIADALCFWVKEVPDEYGFKSKPDWVHSFGTWLSETKDGKDSWLLRLCQWIESKRQRHIYVRIDHYDTWGMDHTLAYIVLPMLQQLKATKHGAPNTDDEDVPDSLKATSAPPKESEYDTDANHFLRWDWILGEMIWAFEQKTDDDSDAKFYEHSEKIAGEDFMESINRMKVDWDGLTAHNLRKKNGFRLFGKYYENLWD